MHWGGHVVGHVVDHIFLEMISLIVEYVFPVGMISLVVEWSIDRQKDLLNDKLQIRCLSMLRAIIVVEDRGEHHGAVVGWYQ